MGLPVPREAYPPNLLEQAAQPHPFESLKEGAIGEQIALGMIPATVVAAIRPPLPPIPDPNLLSMPPLTIFDLFQVPSRDWAVTGPRGVSPNPPNNERFPKWEGAPRNVSGPIAP
jgi:hypothetical protein